MGSHPGMLKNSSSKNPKHKAMKKLILYIPKVVSYFFILLFCYAAISKAIDFENFQVQIGQSPLLSAYAGFLSYAVIILELFIVLLLIFPKTNLPGLYASTSLMSAFTIYIFLILNYSDFVPCSCGGILEKMGWAEHLIFNLSCVIIGIVSVFFTDINAGRSKFSITALLFLSNFLCCFIVYILYVRSEGIIKEDNNFTRRYLMHPIIEKKISNLDNSYYYISGSDDKHIYLGNIKLPQQILVIDSTLVIKEIITIELDIKEFPYRKIETKVVGKYYYVYDGTVPVVKRGLLSSSKPQTISQDDAYFSQLDIINNYNSYVLRTQSSKSKNLLIASLHTGSQNKVELWPDFLRKQTDGVFDSDGVLNVDRKMETSFTRTVTEMNLLLLTQLLK
ncbi:MauE/DoxX family redox-associated membrane protein [Chryseobacterium arachidis]|uniref:MauE/DoxX family redox-associated membrane protein n=1 Tax=Chryseobacterium arachidis TaxID=1416778 RepID=UPI003614F55A